MVSLDTATSEELIAALGRSIARSTLEVNQYIFRDNPADYKVPEYDYVAGAVCNIPDWVSEEIVSVVATAAVKEYLRLVKEQYPNEQYDPAMAVSLLQTIAANVDNFHLDNEAFRTFVRNSLPVAEQKVQPQQKSIQSQR